MDRITMMAAVAFSRGEKGSRLLRAFGLHTPFLGAGYTRAHHCGLRLAEKE